MGQEKSGVWPSPHKVKARVLGLSLVESGASAFYKCRWGQDLSAPVLGRQAACSPEPTCLRPHGRGTVPHARPGQGTIKPRKYRFPSVLCVPQAGTALRGPKSERRGSLVPVTIRIPWRSLKQKVLRLDFLCPLYTMKCSVLGTEFGMS